jgi:hypothetical protein
LFIAKAVRLSSEPQEAARIGASTGSDAGRAPFAKGGEVVVDNKPGLFQIVRKVCLLALFGFLAITLAGPILSIVLVILTFALIGFLFWLPIRFLIYGREGALRGGLQGIRAVARRGGRAVGAVWGGTLRVGRELHESLRGTASVIGAVLLEALSGAVVGILLVTTCWPQHAVTPGTVVLAGLLGGLAGVLVVVSRSRRPAESAVESSEPAA